MDLQVIEACLNAPELVQEWRDTLLGWTETVPSERADVLNWAVTLRDQFLETAREIDDPETLDMVLIVRYIELKSHWILLNTQINYEMVRKGHNNQKAVYQASLVSQLLAALEPLIDEDHIERIIEFLTEPVNSVKPFSSETLPSEPSGRLTMQETHSIDPGGMEAQLIALYAEREQLHEELGVSDAADIIAMVRSLEVQLNDLYQEKEEAQ